MRYQVPLEEGRTLETVYVELHHLFTNAVGSPCDRRRVVCCVASVVSHGELRTIGPQDLGGRSAHRWTAVPRTSSTTERYSAALGLNNELCRPRAPPPDRRNRSKMNDSGPALREAVPSALVEVVPPRSTIEMLRCTMPLRLLRDGLLLPPSVPSVPSHASPLPFSPAEILLNLVIVHCWHLRRPQATAKSHHSAAAAVHAWVGTVLRPHCSACQQPSLKRAFAGAL